MNKRNFFLGRYRKNNEISPILNKDLIQKDLGLDVPIKKEDVVISNLVVEAEHSVDTEQKPKKGILATVLTHPLNSLESRVESIDDDFIPNFLKISTQELDVSRGEGNPFFKQIPVLTDIVINDEDSLNHVKYNKVEKIGFPILDFSITPIIDNVDKPFSILEANRHEHILFLYEKSGIVKEYKEFWLNLYHLKSQNLFSYSYYVSWLMTWLSSLDKEKLQVLCFSFIWRKVCELSDDEIFEIIKPTLDAFYQFNDIDLAFTLLEAISLSDIYLPEDWLESYVRFESSIDEGLPKNFTSILINNKKRTQRR